MAKDGKTEKATPKRRSEARKRGQVARSQELNSFFVLAGTVITLAIAAPHIMRTFEETIQTGLKQAGNPDRASAGQLQGLASWGMRETISAVAPILIAAAVCGVVASVMQVGLRISAKALKPSFSRINPLKGMKRVFGTSALVEAAKAVTKLIIIGGIATITIWPKLCEFPQLISLPPGETLHRLGQISFGMVLRVLACYVVIAALDVIYQRVRFSRSLRMSKDEIKQEMRQIDLAPELRRAIRRRQFEQARRRMLAAVPESDVVVVNPTHYAVALKYDGSAPAPRLVAKGRDLIAAKIRQIAIDNDISVVVNPPLARALYRDVEFGQMIPEALYAAVAEVLAYVYRTAGRMGRRRPSLAGSRPAIDRR